MKNLDDLLIGDDEPLKFEGLGGGFEGNEAECKKLLRCGYRKIDWYTLMFDLKQIGATIDDIALKTQIPKGTLNNMMNDRGFETGDRALALVDLYLRNIANILPRIGDPTAK